MNHDRNTINIFVSKPGANENKSLESNTYACISKGTTALHFDESFVVQFKWSHKEKKIPLLVIMVTSLYSL
jgi:hypothetical protein